MTGMGCNSWLWECTLNLIDNWNQCNHWLLYTDYFTRCILRDQDTALEIRCSQSVIPTGPNKIFVIITGSILTRLTVPCPGIARPLRAHGQGTVTGPKPMVVFGFLLVGGPLDPRGPWTLSTLFTHLYAPGSMAQTEWCNKNIKLCHLTS